MHCLVRFITVFSVFLFYSYAHSAEIHFNILDVFEVPKSSNSAFLSDSVGIQITGLTPHTVVTLRVSMGTDQSEASFLTDMSGQIDVSTQAPLSGSYSGVDRDGLIWSMRPTATSSTQGIDLLVEVLSGENTVDASASLPRYFPAPGITTKMITEDGFIGKLHLPPGDGPFPTLIVLGGGEGGLSGSSFMASYYASFGYACLAVAYFGMEGLPVGVDLIPMEYFKKSIDWLNKQPFAQGQKMGITGGSRGAEAALAVASTFDEFDAVISDVGNALPVSGYDFVKGEEISPWTYQGIDLPFQKNLLFGHETFKEHPGGIFAFEFKSIRSWDILQSQESIDASILHLENISAPVLFNGAGDDALWPSLPLSKVGYKRRVAFGVASLDEFYDYQNTGHILGNPPGFPSPETYFLFTPTEGDYWELGGTAQNNERARRISTRRNLLFLEKYLKKI